MTKRTIFEVKVDDIEKRRIPSKHYVYVVQVTWSDGLVQVIYRRYSDFFELQSKLLENFPEEAGRKNPANRTIPFLPGKILFGRSQIREVALKRLDAINDYCRALVRLPAFISNSTDVVLFFEARDDDLLANPQSSLRKADKPGKIESISDPNLCEQYVCIADYEADEKQSVSMRSGEVVDVVEKNENGWWFIGCESGQGWVPCSYLERADGDADDRSISSNDVDLSRPFVCTNDYEPVESDEMRLVKGTLVTVVETNLDGWWMAESMGQRGRVPGCYLTRSDTMKTERLMKTQTHVPVEIVTDLSAISSKAKPVAPRRPSQGPLTLSPRRPSLGPLTLSRLASNGDIYANHAATLEVEVEPVYVAIADFTENVSGGAVITADDVLEVLDKSESGWWFVKTPAGDEGWVPSSHVERRRASPISAAQKASRPPEPPRKHAASSDEELDDSPFKGAHAKLEARSSNSSSKSFPSPESGRARQALEVVSGIKQDIAGKFSKVMARLSPHSSPKAQRKNINSGNRSKLAISGPVADSAVDFSTGKSPASAKQAVEVGAGWSHKAFSHGSDVQYSEASQVMSDYTDGYYDDDDEDKYDYEKVVDEDEDDSVYQNVDSSGNINPNIPEKQFQPPPVPPASKKPAVSGHFDTNKDVAVKQPGNALADALNRFSDESTLSRGPPRPPSAAIKPKIMVQSSQESDTHDYLDLSDGGNEYINDKEETAFHEAPKPPAAALKPSFGKVSKSDDEEPFQKVLHKPKVPQTQPAWAKQKDSHESAPAKPPSTGFKPKPPSSMANKPTPAVLSGNKPLTSVPPVHKSTPALPVNKASPSPPVHKSTSPVPPMKKPTPPGAPVNKPKPPSSNLKPTGSTPSEGTNSSVSNIKDRFQNQKPSVAAKAESNSGDTPEFLQNKLRPVGKAPAQNGSSKPKWGPNGSTPSPPKPPLKPLGNVKTPPGIGAGLRKTPGPNSQSDSNGSKPSGGVNALKSRFEK